MNRKVAPLMVVLVAILSGFPILVEGAEPEVVREESVSVPAWSAQVVQRHHGPRGSDAILIDVFIVERGNRRLLAKDIVGPLVLFEDKRRILSCESQGSAVVGQGPIVLNLDGRRTQIMKHPGYLRECRRIERSNLLLLQYNLMAEGKPYNLVRVLSAEGKVVLDRKFDDEADLSVSDDGKTYRVRIPAPDLPG
jgi:hypothetical protein